MANNTTGFKFSNDPASPASDLTAENLNMSVEKALIRNIASNAVSSEHITQSVAGAGLGGGGGNPLNVKVDNKTLQITNDTVIVKEGGIDTMHIAEGAITQEKLAETLNEVITNIQKGIYSTLYKVGDYFITENETNPSERFGGEWELVKGRFLIGSDSGDANPKYPLKATGGAAEVVLSGEQMPRHAHAITTQIVRDYYSRGEHLESSGGGLRRSTDVVTDPAGGDSEGNTKAHNNIPPYRAAYMWRKISDTTPE